MNKEIAKYIRNYFPNLMTDDERLALQYHMYAYKIDNSSSKNFQEEKLTSNQKTLEFLKNGYEEFEHSVAERIFKETPDKIYFNLCPKCEKIARTPYARQCRHCKHNWHDQIAGKFKLNTTFKLTGRHFYFLGQITKGEITRGQYIDLTMLGLSRRIQIDVIDFALKKENGNNNEDIGIGTHGLSEEEMKMIKEIDSFGKTIDILKTI